MALELVRIEDLRCVERAELQLSRQRNYIFGPNGAGKTSLLEAIYLLSRGRSFRTRQNRRLIRHGRAALTVYGEVDGQGQRHRLGLRLSPAGLEMRLDGGGAAKVADLARQLPANVIEPNIHQLIEGGPSKRRRFLDWGVFHVEQSFLEAWRRYRRVLGQRNAALKLGQSTQAWDPAFVAEGEAVHRLRGEYVARLAPVVASMGEALLGRPLTITYRSGWQASQPLSDAITASQARDREHGATQVGPHRADLGLAMEERGVREEASRGQQKLVAAALILAQVTVFAAERGEGGILLVDDPAAELDTRSFTALMSALDTVPAQLVLTGLSARALPPATGFPVFHVEQGTVSAVV